MMMDTIAIEPLAPRSLSDALHFVCSWDADDVYERFGTLGLGGPEWLIAQLHSKSRPAVVAREASNVVGLLDYIRLNGYIHIGIVVDRARRRRAIGSALIAHVLRAKPAGDEVAAQCRPDNAAAIGLLRACGFTRVASSRDELEWLHA